MNLLPHLTSYNDFPAPTVVTVLMIAWFLQMGLHEGAHAIVADRLGDPVPRAMGKVSINPFTHVTWNDPWSVIGAAIVPFVTATIFPVAMGMAHVQISRGHSTANHAKIAIAGPIGSFVAGLIAIVLWVALFPLLRNSGPEAVNFLQFACWATLLTALVYGIFNLIPIPPLDGSEILYHYMNPDGRRLMDHIRPYGFFILIGLFWIGGVGTESFEKLIQAREWIMSSLVSFY